MSRPILLCTVGTSLLYPNLVGLRKALAADEARPEAQWTIKPGLRAAALELAEAHDSKDWGAVASALALFPIEERTLSWARGGTGWSLACRAAPGTPTTNRLWRLPDPIANRST